MAIRLREVRGEGIALCAAKSNPEPGDIYINDFWHYALALKFGTDEGIDYSDDPATKVMLEEEAKYVAENPNWNSMPSE